MLDHDQSHPMKTFLARVFLLSCCQLSTIGAAFSQDLRSWIDVSAMYDHLILNECPSYITVPGQSYDIATEGVYNTYEPKMSLELGYKVEKKFRKTAFWVYSGFVAGYRRLDLTLTDENLYFLRTTGDQPEEVYFQAYIKRNLVTAQIPVGIRFPLANTFAIGLSVRNNFVISVISSEEVNEPSFKYKLDGLDRRSPHQYVPEISGDVEYRVGRCAVSVKYLYGLRPIYPEIKNSCNQLITSEARFSSLLLSFSMALSKN